MLNMNEQSMIAKYQFREGQRSTAHYFIYFCDQKHNIYHVYYHSEKINDLALYINTHKHADFV
jgi:hypothetical protein